VEETVERVWGGGRGGGGGVGGMRVTAICACSPSVLMALSTRSRDRELEVVGVCADAVHVGRRRTRRVWCLFWAAAREGRRSCGDAAEVDPDRPAAARGSPRAGESSSRSFHGSRELVDVADDRVEDRGH